MKTIKLKIQNKQDFTMEQKKFNSIARYSYNRFLEGLDENSVRAKCRQIFAGLNSWFVQCAIKEGRAIFEKSNGRKIIFGGKHNFEKYMNGLITKDEYTAHKLYPINIQGEKLQKGNRLFDFDLLNSRITLKISKSNHTVIQLPRLRNNLKKELSIVQNLTDEKKLTVTVKFNSEYAWFTYDETALENEKYTNLKRNRVLGLDLNPNYIGLSVIEFNDHDDFKVLHKQVFDLNKLNTLSGKASNERASIHLTNKRKFELIEICHEISSLVDYWKCSKLAIEDLNIKSSDKKQGKHFNRLCNNVWNRNLVVNKLKLLSSIHGFELVEVNPAYSSFIGNLLYGNQNTPDMIASSIEISRRGYKKFSKGWFYPTFSTEGIDEQWKQTLAGAESWKSAFNQIKKSGLKYRFQLLVYIQNAVFSKIHRRKRVIVHCFS